MQNFQKTIECSEVTTKFLGETMKQLLPRLRMLKLAINNSNKDKILLKITEAQYFGKALQGKLIEFKKSDLPLPGEINSIEPELIDELLNVLNLPQVRQ